MPALVIPRIEVMQIQISTEIKTEIAGLEKEAMRVQDNPFALTMAVGKIRYLRDILSNLSHANFETIKALWMKYVRKSADLWRCACPTGFYFQRLRQKSSQKHAVAGST